MSLLGYLKDRKLEVQKEFDSSCEIKARTYDEAAKQMAKKNSIILKIDIALEEVIKLTSFDHEFDRVLMLNLQYDKWNLKRRRALNSSNEKPIIIINKSDL